MIAIVLCKNAVLCLISFKRAHHNHKKAEVHVKNTKTQIYEKTYEKMQLLFIYLSREGRGTVSKTVFLKCVVF